MINSGSSSIKCTLYRMPEQEVLASCTVEKIGEGDSAVTFSGGPASFNRPCQADNHRQAFDVVVEALLAEEAGVLDELGEIAAVGHRVVHGGEKVRTSTVADKGLIELIRENSKLAPLHNPANLSALLAAVEKLPGKLQVAVFDTAFHVTMPPKAFLYAIPYELYEQHDVRRYGFHGTSHRYVAEKGAELLGIPPEECNLITLHLGNGCSATAVRGGESVDTSMGLTPLEGLVMGTRCGDIDPALSFFFTESLGMTSREVYDMLNKQSGLAGLSGVGNDMRAVLAAARSGSERAEQALEIFCYRIKKYIGAYYAVLGEVHGLVFTAGIGENCAEVRGRFGIGLERLGIKLDDRKNEATVGGAAVISADDSPTAVLVVPTDEELKIAIDAYQLYQERKGQG